MPASASNTNVVQSAAALAGAVGDDATHIAAWDGDTPGTDNLLGSQAISTDPDALALGDRYQFAAGMLVITQPEGPGETNHLSERKARGAVAGGVWVSWHTGAPGANGTANRITEIASTEIAAADFSFTRT